MKQFSTYTLLLAAILFMGACKKATEGLNVNPNSPTAAPYKLVLAGAETNAIAIYEGTLARTAGMWSRSFTGADRQYVDLYNYNTTAEDYNDGWDNMYASAIAQLQIAEGGALAANDKISAGIAEVQMAEAFSTAADLFEDVPFSQVGNVAKYPTPAFDKQATVYAGAQALLDKAIASFNAGITAKLKGVTNDFYFAGDPASWLPIAYTLKARIALHTRDYAGAITNAKLGISNPSGDFKSPHGSTYLKDFNIYYSFLTYDRSGYMNAQGAIAPAFLNSADPLYKGNAKTDETARFEYLYQTGLNTSGLDPNVLVDFDWGNPTDQNGFFGATTSFPRVTFEENTLILAEAYAKTGDNANALVALNAQREFLNGGGSISTGYLPDGNKYSDYTLTDFAAGGIANKTGISQSAALLTEILTERYLSFVGSLEQWNDVRRTGNYLKIPPVKGTTIPQRMFYGQDEVNTNPNTPKQSPSDLFKPTAANATAY